jgi:hypothetical protein
MLEGAIRTEGAGLREHQGRANDALDLDQCKRFAIFSLGARCETSADFKSAIDSTFARKARLRTGSRRALVTALRAL